MPAASPTQLAEAANIATHLPSLLVSVGAALVLIERASNDGSTAVVVSALVYGISLIALYAASTGYHLYGYSGKLRLAARWRIIDQCAIFGLIVGTYTPVCLLGINSRQGLLLLGVVVLVAAIGVTLKLSSNGGCDTLCIVSYLASGWSLLAIYGEVTTLLDPAVWQLILHGGVVYSLGVIFYAWRSLRYHHALWHGFVMVGSGLHYLAVLRLVG